MHPAQCDRARGCARTRWLRQACPHPTDRRATLVTLTARGAEAAAAVHADYREGASVLLDGISASDLAGFVATADRVVSRLRAAADQPR